MGLRTGITGHARRLPDRLDELHGPWQGTVVLPVHLTWHQFRAFDLARRKARLLRYSIVISQVRRQHLGLRALAAALHAHDHVFAQVISLAYAAELRLRGISMVLITLDPVNISTAMLTANPTHAKACIRLPWDLLVCRYRS